MVRRSRVCGGDCESPSVDYSPPTSPPPSNCSVIATVRGWLTDEGGRLESVETGVALLIPPGALPPGPSHLVYFKVCRPDIQTVLMAPLLDQGKGTSTPTLSRLETLFLFNRGCRMAFPCIIETNRCVCVVLCRWGSSQPAGAVRPQRFALPAAGRIADPSRRVAGSARGMERLVEDVQRKRPVARDRNGAQRYHHHQQRRSSARCQRTNRATQHHQKEPQLPLRLRRPFLKLCNVLSSLTILIISYNLDFFDFFDLTINWLHIVHVNIELPLANEFQSVSFITVCNCTVVW